MLCHLAVYALGVYVDEAAAKKHLASKFKSSDRNSLASNQDMFDSKWSARSTGAGPVRLCSAGTYDFYQRYIHGSFRNTITVPWLVPSLVVHHIKRLVMNFLIIACVNMGTQLKNIHAHVRDYIRMNVLAHNRNVSTKKS